MAVLVDTGIFVSGADRDEPRHEDSASLLRARRAELVVPAPVVAEAAWMIEDRLGPAAEAAFLRLATSLKIIDLDPAAHARRRRV